MPEEPKTPKKDKKKEKVPKKEAVKSMSILSFLKHTKKLDTPLQSDPGNTDPEEKEEDLPTKSGTNAVDIIKEASSSSYSIESLLAELKERMDLGSKESQKRLETLHQHAKDRYLRHHVKAWTADLGYSTLHHGLLQLLPYSADHGSQDYPI